MSTALRPTRTDEAPPLTVTAWRDYDPHASTLTGMSLGEVSLSGPIGQASEQLWNLGARRIVMPDAIDLTPTATATEDAARQAVRSLSLVRDLTARAILVEWRLRLDREDEETWKLLSHLQPPQAMDGPDQADEQLLSWRHSHYLCKCLWRQGPGFIQIRDRRWGDLRRFTSDEPHYHDAIAALDYGTVASTVSRNVLDDFVGEHLVLTVGEIAWWLPYRVKRWIQEAMAI